MHASNTARRHEEQVEMTERFGCRVPFSIKRILAKQA